MTVKGSALPDVRRQDQQVLCRMAEQALETALDRDRVVVKRRSLGAPSERGTWVRLSVCTAASAARRGGLEATAALPEAVAAPRWLQSRAWREGELLWRVEETEQVTTPVLQSGGVLTCDPGLSSEWWQRLHASLQALATVDIARVATPHTHPISQQRITEMLAPSAPEVDATVTEWTVAHGDLSWVNLTAPECWILDWEDAGQAPRGWDAATLWAASLAVPELADRVQDVFAADLQARTGLVCQLYQATELLQAGPDYAGDLFAPAQAARERLISELTRRPRAGSGRR